MPVKPASHVHVCDPTVLVHAAFESQPWALALAAATAASMARWNSESGMLRPGDSPQCR